MSKRKRHRIVTILSIIFLFLLLLFIQAYHHVENIVERSLTLVESEFDIPVFYAGEAEPAGYLKRTLDKPFQIYLSDEQVNWKFVELALLSFEDRSFFHHHGFDSYGIARAFINNLFNDKKQGGSTLTMQLSRTLPGKIHRMKRGYIKKVFELFAAIVLERKFTKRKLVCLYLSTIPIGGVRGLEAASRYYFHKPSKRLTFEEFIALTRAIRSPSRQNPKCIASANQNLSEAASTLRHLGLISRKTWLKLKNTQLVMHDSPLKNKLKNQGISVIEVYGDYTKLRLRPELKRLLKLELQTPPSYHTGIQLSIEKKKQTVCEHILEQYKNNYNSTAIAILISNSEGKILATAQANNTTDLCINPYLDIGSSLKPFLFICFVELGENPFNPIRRHAPTRETFTFYDGHSYKNWEVHDSTLVPNGSYTLENGLVYSTNVSFVSLYFRYPGMVEVKMASLFGLHFDSSVPSWLLGSNTALLSMCDLNRLYVVFTAKSVPERLSILKEEYIRAAPVYVSKNTLTRTKAALRRVAEEGTACNLRALGHTLLAKTGTSNKAKSGRVVVINENNEIIHVLMLDNNSKGNPLISGGNGPTLIARSYLLNLYGTAGRKPCIMN